MGDQVIADQVPKPKRIYIRKEKHTCEYVKVSGENKGVKCERNCTKSHIIGGVTQYRCCLHNPTTMNNISVNNTMNYRRKRQQIVDLYEAQ